MARTPSANWTSAMAKSSSAPVVHASIAVDVSTTLVAVQGYSSAINAPSSIASVTGVNATMDVIDRKLGASRAVVTFLNDGLARSWVTTYRLAGKIITIKFGDRALGLSDLEPLFSGVIDKVRTYPDGRVELTCVDAVGMLLTTATSGWWMNQHPAQTSLDMIVRAALPSSLYDAATYDVTNAQYAPISHWCVERGGMTATGELDMTLIEPEKIGVLLEQLAVLMNGSHIVREDGKLSFKRYDSSAAVVANWTEDDLDPESFEVIETDGNAINAVVFSFHKGADGDPAQMQTVWSTNEAARAAFAAYGSALRYIVKEIKSEWIQGVGKLALLSTFSPTHPATGETFDLAGYYVTGMCGTRWPNFMTDAQPAAAQLDDTHTAILSVAPSSLSGLGTELIEVDRCTVDPNEKFVAISSPNGLGHDSISGDYIYPHVATYRVKTRGYAGTDPGWHDSSDRVNAYDVTIPLAVCSNILARASYGMPVIKVRTNLSQHFVQLGDFVTVTTNRYASYGDDGLDTLSVFEVTGKDVVTSGPDIGITWTLTRAYKTSPPSYTISPTLMQLANGGVGQGLTAASDSGTTHLATVAGGVAAAGAGLTVTVTQADIQIGSISKRIPARTITLPASKDCYLWFDSSRAGYGFSIVTTGGASPTLNRWQTMMAKVVTGAATITSVTNYTATKPFADGTVQTDTITTEAVVPKHYASASLGSNAHLNPTFIHLVEVP